MFHMQENQQLYPQHKYALLCWKDIKKIKIYINYG